MRQKHFWFHTGTYELPVEIFDQIIDIAQCRDEGNLLIKINVSQLKRYLQNQTTCFFIDDSGKAGKTFCVQHDVQSAVRKRKKVLCVAWSGITATLLPHGQTVYSTFKLPVPIIEVNKTLPTKAHSEETRKLLNIDAIIWDGIIGTKIWHRHLKYLEERRSF